MIGEIRTVRTPYYNAKQKKLSFKKRPALIIAQADIGDYVILPVSTITKEKNRDEEYDIKVDPDEYPKLHLTQVSYVRTHKQTIAHIQEIGPLCGDMKTNYRELYLKILSKREQFSASITQQALK